MEKEFIEYVEALALKELGFTGSCLLQYYLNKEGICLMDIKNQNGLNWDWFENNQHETACLAPLYQQAFRWFREKHRLISSVDISEEGTAQEHYFVTISTQGSYGFFKTYEEAELECLKKLIEIVKEKNQ